MKFLFPHPPSFLFLSILPFFKEDERFFNLFCPLMNTLYNELLSLFGTDTHEIKEREDQK